MGGKIVPVARRQDYSLNTPANGELTIPLGPPLFIPDTVSGVLTAVVYSWSLNDTGAKISFGVFNVFLPNKGEAAVMNTSDIPARIELTSSSSTAQLKQAELTAPLGPYLQCSLVYEQGATAAATPSSVDFELLLILRDR